ncbi:DUF2268 domain-containing putative Zn-dependent protease [Muriicola soli]|uniref:DUF2268 domain-containing protein n=1 Tax=Muriicola soli TaxID=2507538 RepID=A0A411E9R3_9FLAO|nr:DUF2268 domain-containing putative Zn-dependent protease [Muriicola soli]QBA64475.1 hypothetical protein EQY75_08025 [Muriicola soli]
MRLFCQALNLIGIVFLVMLMSQCRGVTDINKKATPAKVLADLNTVFDDYERLEKSGKYAELASKIIEANTDLESAQIYVEAATLYHLAEKKDSAIIMLHKAIDRGMANPTILKKFPGLENVRSEQMEGLTLRLDSLKKVLHKISNFALETRAMDQFWPYFKQARSNPDSARTFLKAYILEGPPEIRDYYAIRYYNLDNMYGQMINGAPEYYTYLMSHLNNDSLDGLKNKAAAAMKTFKGLYPNAVFPKVYIVPGLLNSGGTASEMGLFIGGDMYGRSAEMPLHELNEWQKGAIMNAKDLPQLILHELMHFQQNYSDRERENTVLYKVIEEGVCDFLSELSSGEAIESEQLQYLKSASNLDSVLQELKRDLYSEDLSLWMYNGGSIEDRPADLGYAMGYLITKSYYRNCKDKKQCLEDLLNTNDMKAILKGSDYGRILEEQPDI